MDLSDPRRQRLKVAFIGTSCTGKTTLCDQLGSRPDWLVAREAAREFFAEHPTAVPDRFSFEIQLQIQDGVFFNERLVEEASESKSIACDRSVIDAAVYVRYGGDAQGARRLYERAIPHIHSYDLILVPNPNDIPYQKDDIRAEDFSVRMAIHLEFLSFLEVQAIPFTILSGDARTRLTELDRLLATSTGI